MYPCGLWGWSWAGLRRGPVAGMLRELLVGVYGQQVRGWLVFQKAGHKGVVK
jgi:hypothetical protein